MLSSERWCCSACDIVLCAGIGWQAGRNGVMAPRDAGKLAFSFDAEGGGGGGSATLQRDQSQAVRFSDVRSLPPIWGFSHLSCKKYVRNCVVSDMCPGCPYLPFV